MSEASVSRQPIFDRKLKVVGYELLFKGRPIDLVAIDGDRATSSVIVDALTEIGLQRIVGRHMAWVNVTREFILSGMVEAVPPGLVGLEILEDQVIDGELVAAVVALKEQGYQIALDDFCYSTDTDPLLEIADVVKLDFVALGREGMVEHMALLAPFDLTILAEKIETRQDHAFCLELGCERFQGYFYRKPETLSERRIEANRFSLLQLMAALHDPALDLQHVERLITNDVALSLRLLRYINSAYFGLRHEVSSIAQALALLGIENVKRWTTLSIFASVDGKPSELTVTALVRGRFCELTGAGLRNSGRSQLFTLGLFSVIDALMDTPIEVVLASLPFPDDMTQALITHAGAMGELLDCVAAIEAGDFETAEALFPGCADHYVDAIAWVNEVSGVLDAAPVAAAAPS